MIYSKNNIIRLKITDIGVGGEGIGKAEGFPFFVKNAVVGDEVLAQITALKKSYGYAKVTEIIKESEFRVKPPCPNSLRCGGCQLMQMDYAAQLKFKESKVRNNLERIGSQQLSAATLYPIIGMNNPPLRYRNKLEVPVGLSSDGRAVTGFYAGRTHYIIENDDCPVSPESDRIILAAVRNFIEENNISVYDEKTHTGLFRHILIRHGFSTGEIMVCAVLNGASFNEFANNEDSSILVERLQIVKTARRKDLAEATNNAENMDYKFARTICGLRLPDSAITSICVNVNTQKSNVILGDKTVCLYGNKYITDKIGDLIFQISAQSFYQINPVQTEKLYRTALEYAQLTGEETVWDLYCGIGTISLFLAGKAKMVYGVETLLSAIENARDNARLNNIGNVDFICGKAEEVFPARAREAIRQGDNCGKSSGNQIQSNDKQSRADVVVLDPPRKGCEKRLLDTILKVKPNRIVYVSCDSATLARDIKILTEGGAYHLDKVQSVDMFPHTVHVETVVLMSRA